MNEEDPERDRRRRRRRRRRRKVYSRLRRRGIASVRARLTNPRRLGTAIREGVGCQGLYPHSPFGLVTRLLAQGGVVRCEFFGQRN